MDPEEARKLTRAPHIVTVSIGASTVDLTGILKANDDGTYQVDTGLGSLENPNFVQHFSAAQIVRARPV